MFNPKIKHLKKITLLICSIVTLFAFNINVSATAKSKLVAPKLSTRYTYSNKMEINIDNIKSYNNKTKFQVIINSKLVKTVTAEAVKRNKNFICITYTADKYLKPNTTYGVYVKAVLNGVKSKATRYVKKTPSATYYTIAKNTNYYKYTKGKFKLYKKVNTTQYATGNIANSKAIILNGKSKSNKVSYIKITNGNFKGCFVKISSVYRTQTASAKRNIVAKYGASMNGGSYIWAGTSYRATDCSGLTMLSYQQVGINISHSCYTQATMGKAVSSKNMKPGDIIICRNYGHAMLYIGNGKVVHAMNSYDGIQIQSASTAMYYNGPVNAIRRIIV